MIPFLDRIEEKKRINRLLDGESGAFCCLYGRRRCGKTRLLRECLRGRSNVLYYVADKSDRAAQLSRFINEAAALNPVIASAAGLDWSSVLDLWLALMPNGAVLVFDEFPYLVEQDEALPSILQRIVDKLQDTGKKIIICGSSQRMMQGFVLKASEPLYGRAREILPIAPLKFGWMKEAFPKLSPWDRLKSYGVWGGVPRYWEIQAEEPDLWLTGMYALRLESFAMNRSFCFLMMSGMLLRHPLCCHLSARERTGPARSPLVWRGR